MATVDLDSVQFWAPPSNPFPYKQRTTSSQSKGRSICTNSSRNQPAPLHKADRIFKPNDQSKSAIIAARHQGDDFAAGAQGRNNDPTNRDDDLSSIETLRDQIYRNPEDTLQYLEEPALDTSGSRLSPIQSKLDDGAGDSKGNRDKPGILEDDESDTPDPEAAAVSAFELSKPTDPSGHELWYDVEDERFVDEDLRPFPPLEQEGLASTPTPAQDQHHSCHHSPGSPQDHTNQHGNDRTTPSASEEPTPHSLPPSLDGNGGGGSEEENVSELEKDLLLALEKQDKSLSLASAPAPSSPRPRRHSVEPSHPQTDQEHDQSGTGNVRLEEITHGSPLRSQDRGEEPQEQQQRQQSEVYLKHSATPINDGHRHTSRVSRSPSAPIGRALGSEPERGKRREKRQHQGANKEISCDIHHSEDSDRSHETNEKDAEDDEDPRPAKRRKLPPVPTHQALTPAHEHGPAPRLGRPRGLTPSSTTQPEIDDAQSRADHEHPSTPVDDQSHSTPRTSRSPPALAESAPVSEYQEWPFQGFLKRAKIGKETTYNLEFQLSHIREHLHLSAEAATPHDAGPHSKMHSAAVRPQIKRARWAPEEDATILKMREEDGCSWEEIHAALPHRTRDAIQVRFSTKLKK